MFNRKQRLIEKLRKEVSIEICKELMFNIKAEILNRGWENYGDIDSEELLTIFDDILSNKIQSIYTYNGTEKIRKS